MFSKLAFRTGICILLLKSTLALSYPATFQAEVRTYQVKSFHNLQKVEGLLPALLNMHLELYRGYVKNTNAISVRLRQLKRTSRSVSPTATALQKQLTWEYNGMRLHELYFENLSPVAINTEGSLYSQIERDFGSIENWQREFEAIAQTRGIGWVILYYDLASDRLMNTWIEEHNIGPLVNNLPIVVMDVWEHAYLTQFGLNRLKYVQKFIQNISWDICEKRFKGAKSTQ